MPFVIKNTFICEVNATAAGEEASSPSNPRRQRRRARTHHADGSGSGSNSCSDHSGEEELHGGEAAREQESSENSEASHAVPTSSGRGRSISSLRVAQLLPELPKLAFEEEGAKELAELVETASREDVVSLAQTFRGCVQEASRHPFAHLLIESFVHNLGTDDCQFIVDELLLPNHDIAAMAMDNFGSSVLATLLIFANAEVSSSMAEIVDRAFDGDATKLTHHKHGHKVAQAVLEHGSSQHLHMIAVALVKEAARATRHRFAAQVVAEALLQCNNEDVLLLASAILSKPGAVVSLACHCFGVHVVRSLLRIPQFAPTVLEDMKNSQKKLQKDKFGAELLLELGLGSGANGGA
eukprot:CAMPEP_0206465764 /NCGR_PEP_ID=MMETSP0324_2-20121206/28035_1 /ASSEMBLY_ACC=CAM_ASM_000836 /TAXON_ID=2866 /ORGANISM="Crypthecodinium cohnii, Strain Seligo" /LENGTH=352 /DNA_ID=CAMNT_0053938707 /DNA_START=142 /DNA_END=1200 /DNA_ORIENTATION=+